MKQVHLQLLGGFRLFVDGEVRVDDSSARKKPLALVKLLALQSGRALHRDEACDALWPDLDPQAATAQLRKNRFHLRTMLQGEAIGFEVVEMSGDQIRLAEAVTIDTEAFRRQAASARKVRVESLAYAEALNLYAGELLPNDRFESWTDGPRAELARERDMLLSELGAIYMSQGKLGPAVEVYEQLHEADGFNEQHLRSLMLAYVRTGARVKAAETFKRFRSTLLQDLGSEPELETLEALRRIESEQLADGDGPSPGKTTLRDGVTVGREHELTILREAYAQTRSGNGRVVLVTGEAGIGKTHLLRAMEAYAVLDGADVRWGRSYEGDLRHGYEPWIQMLGGKRSLTEYIDETSPLSQGQTDGLSNGALRETVSPESLQRLYADVCAHLAKLASARPLVVLLDDLHWADGDSLQLLLHAGRALRDSRVLIICAVRDGDPSAVAALHDVLARLQREPHAQDIALPGLGRQATAALIESESHAQPTTRFVDWLWEQTRGNPLFVTQILRAYDGAWDAATANASNLEIPTQVLAVIRLRLDRLDDDARDVLRTAAVLGQEFEVQTLALIRGISALNLREILQPAFGARVCRWRATGSEIVEFAHPLIAHVLYGEWGPTRRAEEHMHAAQTLDASPGMSEDLFTLAYHYLQGAEAGCADRAIEVAVEAGLRSVADGAYQEGARLFDDALRVQERALPDDRERHCELLHLASYWRRIAGRHDEAKAAIYELLREARAIESADYFGRGALRLAAHSYSSMTVDEQVVALLEEAVQLVGTSDVALRAMLLARLASRLEADPSPRRRDQAAAEAHELVKGIEEPAAITEVLWACHDATSGPDNLEERLRTTADLVTWGQRLPEKIAVAAGHLRRFAALLERGGRTEAEHELTLLARVAEGRNMPSHMRSLQTCRVGLMVMSGDFVTAERMAAENLAAGQPYDPDATAIFGAQLFSIRWLQGRAGELSQLVQGALEPTPSFLPWRAALGVMHAATGAHEAARAEFEGFAADGFSSVPRTRYWTVMLAMLGEVCAYLQDERRAEILYDLLSPFRERTGVGGLGHVCTGSNERVLGILAATMKRWDASEEHFERALRANRTLRALPWIARTLDGYASMLLRRGCSLDDEQVRASMREATAIAGELGIPRAGLSGAYTVSP